MKLLVKNAHKTAQMWCKWYWGHMGQWW